jgi:hypothetical protein
VVGVARTSPTLMAWRAVDNGERRSYGAKAPTHFTAFKGTTEVVPFPKPARIKVSSSSSGYSCTIFSDLRYA